MTGIEGDEDAAVCLWKENEVRRESRNAPVLADLDGASARVNHIIPSQPAGLLTVGAAPYAGSGVEVHINW